MKPLKNLLPAVDDTATRALVDVQTAITKVKEIITYNVSHGTGEKETTAQLNKAIAEECNRVSNVGLREQMRKSLVDAARAWHFLLKEQYRVLDNHLAKANQRQPLGIDINNLLAMTPYQKEIEFAKILDDGTAPGIPIIRDYRNSVKSALKALSAEPPKVVTRHDGATYVMPLRNRAEMAVRYDAHVKAVEGLQADGVDLAWTSSHPNCSPRCKDYQGRLWSMSGKSGNIDGIPYSPIDEALKGKKGDGNGIISGYNCRHRLIAYKKGSKPPQDFTEAEIKHEYSIDKQQRSYENRIRQMKTEERELRAAGFTKEASAIRKKWRRLTVDYQLYSVEHDRAYYPDRCTIDRAELEHPAVGEPQGESDVLPYNKEIEQPEYKEKFDGLFDNKKVTDKVIKEARRSLKLNDGTSNERGVFITNDGKSEYGFTGTNSQAVFDVSRLPKKAQSVVLVHNHPHSGTFSSDDMAVLNDNPQIKTLIAAGHDGTVYSLSIGDGKRIDNRVRDEYNRIYYSNGENAELAVVRIAEKYNWRYEKR